MRIIEQEMLEAIGDTRGWEKDNTKVSVAVGNSVLTTCVSLHGNQIAAIRQEPNSLELRISDCGWQTRTTKSRLNCILSYFNLTGIHQSKGEWFRGDAPFEGSEVIKLQA